MAAIKKAFGGIMILFLIMGLSNLLFRPDFPTEVVENHIAPRLAAPLTERTMARALSSFVQSGHYEGSNGSGAAMQFPSNSGPVTLSSRDVSVLNARYREMRKETALAGGEYAQFREELRREQMAADGWGDSSY